MGYLTPFSNDVNFRLVFQTYCFAKAAILSHAEYTHGFRGKIIGQIRGGLNSPRNNSNLSLLEYDG